MRFFFTILFAAISYGAVHVMEQERILPEHAAAGCVLIIFAATISWFRIISPSGR